jgi:uncharacterized protein with GYD domain
MQKFVMMGRYTSEGLKGIKKARTKKVVELLKKQGGRVNAMYALLGPKDLIFIVDFPGIKEVIRAAISVSKATGIGFSSFPAITVEEFDRITG